MTVVLTSSVTLQFILCTVGCIGFGMMFNAQGRNLFYASIGAFIDWSVYYVVSLYADNSFVPVFAASFAVAVYAQIMARVCKSPATIFLTVSIFPMIPGARLYYMTYNLVMGEVEAAKSEGTIMLVTLVAIATGFIVVAVFNKYTFMVIDYLKKRIKKE